MHPSLTRPIQLRLLGEFDVAIDDISGSRVIKYTKPRFLLAVLALSQGRPISRSDLASMFWPDGHQDSRANLRHALFVLRRLFEAVPDAWISTSRTLALNPDVIMVDVLALTGSYAELGYQERLAYDRGSLLEYMDLPDSTAFMAWRNQWQSRIERDIAECREGLISQFLARGEQGEAVQSAKSWVHQHPGDESAHRCLIRLLRDTGNDEAAVLALEHCRGMLREHRNTEPSEQTLALLAGAAAAAVPAAEGASGADTRDPSSRQHRPLALLGVTLMVDSPDIESEDPAQHLQTAVGRVRSKAEALGAQVQMGADGSLLIVFGYPALAERPTHVCARLACALRETVLPDSVCAGMGMHADVGVVHKGDPQHLIHLLGQRAMKLAYLAELGEILLTPGARDRVIDEFTVHYEIRHGHAQYVLDSPRGVRTVGRMFGRLREFDTLVRLWVRLPMAQAPTSMVVKGEPGIGKSLLAGVMAEYVRRTGGDVRLIFSEEGCEHKPFHPVLSYLPGTLAQPDGSEVLVDQGAEDSSRQAILENLASALLQRSRPDIPLLVVWEDLHWADPSSLSVISTLLRRTQSAPTLFLATARNEFEWVVPGNELMLASLERRAMAELVMHRSRGLRLSSSQRDQIVEKADGIPLFADEIVRQVAQGAEITATPVMLDLIAARVSALEPAARQFAQLAAVAGRIDDNLVTRASQELGVSTKRVMNLVRQLRQHDLIEDGMPARFCHALTRDAVYQMMDPAQRRIQHANVAQFLIGRDPRVARVEAALIAHHLDAAGHADACHWWCIAGRDALAQSAASEADAMAGRALAALDRIDDEQQRRKAEFECQLLRGAVLTLLKGGGAAETSQAYQRVAQLRQHDDDADMQFQVLWGEWVVAFNTTAHADALRLAENLLHEAEQRDSDMVLGSAQYALGQTRLFMGDVARAERWLRTCLHTLGRRAAAGRRMPAWGAERAHSARGLLAWVLALQGRDEEGAELVQAGLAGRNEPGQLPSRVLCQAVLCELHRLRGDVEGTLAAAATLKGMTDGIDLTFWRALADGMTGWAITHRGDSQGLPAIERAIQVADRAMPVWQSLLELLLADCLNSLGQPDLALEAIERGGALIEAYGTQLVRGAHLCLTGDALAVGEQPDRAIHFWQQAVVESRRLGLSLYARRAEIRLSTPAGSVGYASMG